MLRAKSTDHSLSEHILIITLCALRCCKPGMSSLLTLMVKKHCETVVFIADSLNEFINEYVCVKCVSTSVIEFYSIFSVECACMQYCLTYL